VEERIEILGKLTGSLPNVKIDSFTGLAVEYAKKCQAVALVRGVRSLNDYAYEVQMALMNRAMQPELETVFIPTSPQYSHISSTLAKEIAIHHGDLKLLVPDLVVARLSQKLAQRP